MLPGHRLERHAAEAIRLTKFAAKAGADGALLVSPYYNRPTQEGLYAHFATDRRERAIFRIVLYNVPGRTGRNVEPETIERCRRSDRSWRLKKRAARSTRSAMCSRERI